MAAQSAFPPFDPGEQTRLEGMGEVWIQPPIMQVVTTQPPPARPGPGQLTFGPNQQVLEPQAEQPTQMSMLPDPQPWELSDDPVRPGGPRGRLGRRRSKAGISPGQTSLF